MKMKIKPARILAVAVALLLAGCAMTPSAQTLPELTYGHLRPINLGVWTLEIVSDYSPTMAPPNVEHRMQTSPDKALRRWVTDRLILAGGVDYARLTILDASVVEKRLNTEGGLKGMFINEQSERYQANLRVKLEIFGPGGASRGFATADAARSITIAEDVSLNQREQVWFNLIEALMNDFNAEFEKNIRKYLAKWMS
jgi:hypothetical protein